jgi:ribonucleoside-triphosphate reductase
MSKKSPRQVLSDLVVFSKYARYIPELKRRETYEEAVQRMMNMHRDMVGGRVPTSLLDRIEQALIERRILASQRALQFGGEAIKRKHMRIYNCSASFCDRPEFFAEAFWLLLCGAGVGFSVQKHHVAKLPPVYEPKEHFEFVIQDSIEGWADCAKALAHAYFEGGPRPVWNATDVRPEGSYISSASGKAPGPKPLLAALSNAERVLSGAVGRKLRPIEAYDIMMFLAEAVRSGGVRRSATIALFSPTDEEMRDAKTGDWFKTNPQRRGSNNSALLIRNKTTRSLFDSLINATREFGEPGFYWADSTEHVPNPCVEILLEPSHEEGTGWGMCNLTSVNLAIVKNGADLCEAAELASALGTIQASYMNTGYLGRVTRKILERDALIGVSLTGVADALERLTPNMLENAVEFVREANASVAKMLGINTAARMTTVKPEGTGSLVLGVGNGVHPHHSRRYIRRMQSSWTDPHVRYLIEKAPRVVEPSSYNRGECYIMFPIELPEGVWTRDQTTATQHLDLVKMFLERWVIPGRNRGTGNHNVSNTVTVKPQEWQAVADAIYEGQGVFGGISLLGSSGDLDYAQPPFVSADGQEDARKDVADLFHATMKAWEEAAIDFTEIREEIDNTDVSAEPACAGGACII